MPREVCSRRAAPHLPISAADRLGEQDCYDVASGGSGVNGGLMIDAGDGVVERMFEHLAARDWDSFGAVLSTGVERTGPFGERVVGRDAYVELMAGGEQATSDDDQRRTTWDVHRVVYTDDSRSAFARITAHVPEGDRELRDYEQVLAFQIDASGLISGIEVFWRNPRS